jgi:hypothetical protein
MPQQSVPQISPPSRPERRESDVPTLVIGGLVFTIGIASAWASNSLGGGLAAMLAALFVLATPYALLA